MYNVTILQSPPPKFEDIQKTIYCDKAVEFLSQLHSNFDKEIEQLYKDRLHRTVNTKFHSTLDFRKSTERTDKSWKIAPLPPRLK